MEHESVRLDSHDGVAAIELDRPASRNALTLDAVRELLGPLRAVAADPLTRAVVLSGAGGAFCSGADLRAPLAEETPRRPSGRPDLSWSLREAFHPVTLLLREMPQPVVAAVAGPAAGIGCSYALACDLVVAAPDARFVLAFRNVGLVPDGGASLLVTARAGVGRAADMALLGRPVTGEEAADWGLVDRLADDPRAAALELATGLADGPAAAQAAIKALLNRPWLEPLRGQLDAEAAAQQRRSDDPEWLEALSAFRERRPPAFRDLPPA